jgi:hypothetical protein
VLTMLSSIIILALPITVIGANFTKVVRRMQQVCLETALCCRAIRCCCAVKVSCESFFRCESAPVAVYLSFVRVWLCASLRTVVALSVRIARRYGWTPPCGAPVCALMRSGVWRHRLLCFVTCRSAF